MFRVSKKKPIKRVVVSRQDNSDDDAEESSSIIASMKKKQKNLKKHSRSIGILSFPVEDKEDDNDSEENSMKRPLSEPQQYGIGFGGGTSDYLDEEIVNDVEPSTKTSYDHASIEALKSKQKYQKVDPSTEENPAQSDESFIPLHANHNQPHVIFTGDEAEAFLGDELDENIPPLPQVAVEKDDANDNHDHEISANWEAQIMKRAGISAPASTTNPSVKSLEDLRGHISGAILQLEERDDEIHRACNRRLVEVNHASELKEKYQSELKDSGTALEYYQRLRYSLTNYVGALRDLKSRLRPLQEALQHTVITGDRWRDWENDTVSVLQKKDCLIQVLGRQVPSELDADTVVDEFGRNIKAQHVIARERRFQQRAKIREVKSIIDGYETDVLHHPSEIDELHERRLALQEALQVALDDLDDQYSSLPLLISIFEEWRERMFQDYQSCHAGMSLADLASVLLQVELCSEFHPLYWSKRSCGFPCASLLQALSSDMPLEETPLYRTVDKVLIPMYEDVLKHLAYNIHSSKQSLSMATYFREVAKLLPKGNILLSKLYDKTIDYIRSALDEFAIPIVSEVHSDDPFVKEAMSYATNIQVARIQKVLANLFASWVPTLGVALVRVILDFCINQFSTLLLSLESGKSEFAKLWMLLSGWLDQPQLLIISSPLRAIASSFELEG